MSETQPTSIPTQLSADHARKRTPREMAGLSLGALGVVYGDIGTSPLYAIRECVFGPHAVTISPANIFGILSLVLWSLLLVVARLGPRLLPSMIIGGSIVLPGALSIG